MPYKNKEDRAAFFIRRRLRLKEMAIASMGGKCEDCGIVSHPDIYDFHHLDPLEKDHSWRTLKKQSLETIKKELSKCALLCANCHRLRHVKWRSYGELNPGLRSDKPALLP